MQKPQLSNEIRYRKLVLRSILSILLFIVVYLFVLAISVVFLGIGVYYFAPAAAGESDFGFLVLSGTLIFIGGHFTITLLRPIFKKSKDSLDHWVQITGNDEPELFELIKKVANSVGTTLPKTVYLSSDSNAAVYFERSLISLFFPVRKDLSIGLGLLNAVTVSEFEAILAHEFAHFSQKSLQLGAHVGAVNHGIHTIIVENNRIVHGEDASKNFITGLIYMLGLFTVPVTILMEKTYTVVNMSYLALSREMEFHADAIASQVIGSVPMASGLLRLSLAQSAYEFTLNYYGDKVLENKKPSNIFPQVKWIMNQIGKDAQLDFQHNLPQVTLSELIRYDHSKLSIEKQWESHPSTRDRIEAINALRSPASANSNALAATLIQNLQTWQEKGTEKLFSNVEFKEQPGTVEFEEFIQDVTPKIKKDREDPIFMGYYDDRIPYNLDLEEALEFEPDDSIRLDQLFSKERTDSLIAGRALEEDARTLQKISKKLIRVRTFDYDGTKYKAADSLKLYNQLKIQADSFWESIFEHDLRIFRFFYQKASKKGLEAEYFAQFKSYNDSLALQEEGEKLRINLLESADFLTKQTPFDTIVYRMELLKALEGEFKASFKMLFENPHVHDAITPKGKEEFPKYLSKDWQYFSDETYDEEALELFFSAVSNYAGMFSHFVEGAGKDVIRMQASLLK